MLKVTNPFNNETLAELPVHTEQQVQAAIGAAVGVRSALARMPAYERAAVLSRTAALIGDSADDLTRLIARESGKPIRYARAEVLRATETFAFAADEARRLHGETIPMDAARGGVGRIGYYVREPIGLVAAITPFNFPLNLVAHKVAPAIAAGCPILLKPSPMTPLTALRLAEIMAEAGLPPHAFQVLIGDADVGRWLTADPRIAMLTFTGSYPVAHRISQTAGVRRTTFELGGNAATIVDEGTPISDSLINRLLVGCFAYSGQVCISVQRLYVHGSLYGEFTDRFVRSAERLRLGDPLDEQTEIGPLINDAAAQRITNWISEATEGGARVLAGGTGEGRLFRPTVLDHVTSDMQVMCAEAFGPVVNLLPYTDFEQALDAVNDSEFGLQAGVFTPSLAHAMQAAQRLQVGGVMINDTPSFRVDHMPYGGNKHSGVGREGPRFAIEEMTTLKMIVINSQL